MLHSDQLANEFNDILNGVEIFAPFQPLDPAVTFYAPLRTSVRDLRLNQDDFQRTSDAWYKDGSGIYRNVGINAPRFEENQLLMEPAQTNKCENYNADPDAALSGIIEGDGISSRVFNPSDLNDAGLSAICSSGYVIQIENNSGATIVASIAGVTGNTAPHTASIWINTFGELARFGLTGQRDDVTTDRLEKIVTTKTPNAGTDTLQFQIFNNRRIQFVLNQLEESPVATSPIVTEGTAGQRAADNIEWTDALAFFNQPQGMVAVDWVPEYDSSILTISNRSLLTLTTNVLNLLYHDNQRVKSYDGVIGSSSLLNPFVAGELIRCVLRYGPSGQLETEIGVYQDGTWYWEFSSTPRDYDGAFPNAGFLRLAFQNPYPQKFGNVTCFNENRGRAWIEANLTP